MQQQTGQFVYINGALQQPNAQNVVGQNVVGQNVVGQNVVAMPQGQQQQQFVVLAPAQQQFVTSKKAYTNYHKKASKIMGIMQIIMGGLLIVFNIAQAGVGYNWLWIYSAGWWGSIFMILAGSFGIAAAHNPTKCKVNTTLVLSILSLVCVVIALTQAALSLAFGCDNYGSRYCKYGAHIGVTVIFLLASLAEFAFALTQSILCCKTCCGHSPSQVNQTQPQGFSNGGLFPCYVHPQGAGSPQVVVMPTGQNVAIPTGQNVAIPTGQNVAIGTGLNTATTAQTAVVSPPEYSK